MKYMGSKNRHAKDILSIVLKDRTPGQWYIEPFVGGFNIIDKVEGERMAIDNNYFLISMFRALLAGWEPPKTVSKEEYYFIKENQHDTPTPLIAFVAFCCSYSGKFWGGYAAGNKPDGTPRNYADESRRNLLKQIETLRGVHMFCGDYRTFCYPLRSIIYCDPPYEGTTKFTGEKFDHVAFWEWVREMSRSGHTVYVSEYNAPEDFVCVWDKTVHNTLVKDTGAKQGTEKLFKLK